MNDHIEIMAREFCKADGELPDELLLNSDTEVGWTLYRDNAVAAIKALEANGWAIVPVEPTDAMLDAYVTNYDRSERLPDPIKSDWLAVKAGVEAAIAARPKP